MHLERRVFSRYKIPARATLFPPAVDAEVLDVSLGGFRCRVLGPVAWGIGDRIHFVVCSPMGPVKGDAQITWARDKEFGLRFVALKPMHQQRLASLIQDLTSQTLSSAYCR